MNPSSQIDFPVTPVIRHYLYTKLGTTFFSYLLTGNTIKDRKSLFTIPGTI